MPSLLANERIRANLLEHIVEYADESAVFASRILDHLKFATYFDGIYGSVPSGELDHKPELLGHILSKHNPSRFTV
jgi:hypothetical protein